MGSLLDWLFKKENKRTCGLIGIVLVCIPLVFLIGRGFRQRLDGYGIIFPPGWVIDTSSVIMGLMLLMGFILIMVGFWPRENGNDE